jgi:ABC-2 type transport system permease protein
VNAIRVALLVAAWEFRRFFKWKQHVAALLITTLGGGLAWGLFALAGRPDAVRTVAVLGAPQLASGDAVQNGIRFVTAPGQDEVALRERVAAREYDGLLVVAPDRAPKLVVRREVLWRSQIEQVLTEARRQQRLREAGLSASELARIVEPVTVAIELQLNRSGSGRAARWTAIIALSLMLLATFTGMSYIFASITGEKQNRVTEQVIAAIPPQSWIDGKILGLSAITGASVLNMVVSAGILFLAGRAFGARIPLSFSLGNSLLLVLVLLFALLGFALWFTALVALAATIDDPNNSTRTPLLFLPMLVVSLCYFVIAAPDGAMARALALLPPASATAMPARLLLTDVGTIEVLASLVLLAVAIAVFRRAAGRIFALGVLMYGKEPSWSEVRRWLREA